MTKPPSPKPMPLTSMPDRLGPVEAADARRNMKAGCQQTAGGSMNINPGKAPEGE